MDELKTIIRALAISKAGNGITVSQLNKDFKALEGYAIPYTKYGFQSLDGMLRTMTDAIQVNGYGLTALVQPLVSEKSKHVREMVKKNKPDRKKPSANHRYYPSQGKYGNNFYHDHYASHFTSDDYADNGFDDEIAYSSVIVTNGTSDNAQKQQQLHNGHREERQTANDSVYINPTSFQDTNNERQKKREEILAKLLKRITPRTTNDVIVPDNTKTINETMNGSIDSSLTELTVPEDAITRKVKIVNALPVHLKPMATAKVVVTSVLNPNHMYIHLLEHTDKLAWLAPHIDDIYSTKATGYEWLIPDAMVQVGMYCAAKYQNRWYRAQVMGPVNFQRVLLSYIDYGYLRYVPLADIRFLTKELASIPCQAVRVALNRVNASEGTWSKECCEQLARMVHRKVFDMSVVSVDVMENILHVILTDSTNCSTVQTVPHESSLNGQLATRSDVVWSAY